MYELWDGDSGNAMGAYGTEAEALAVLRQTIVQDGCDAVATFALLRVSVAGQATVLAQGDALAERACAVSRTEPAHTTTFVKA